MTTTLTSLPQAARQRARMDTFTPPTARNRVATSAQARRPLERLLHMAGWTNEDVDQVRALTADHLAALIAALPPDIDLYAAWARVVAVLNPSPAALTNLLRNQPADRSPHDLLAIIRRGQDIARRQTPREQIYSPITPQRWATDHLLAGNTARDVTGWHHTTPAWLIAWARTGELPSDVAPCPVGEAGLWAYIDAAATYPDAPEAVIATTVMNAPVPTSPSGTLTEWLTKSWADPYDVAAA